MEENKCWGLVDGRRCTGVPVYAAIEHSDWYYSGSLWCEKCMGDSYRRGNRYLRKIKHRKQGET